MKNELVSSTTSEELELARKRLELEELQTELAARELGLATLQAELVAFERRYLRTVGVLLAELDAIDAQIASVLAERAPTDASAQERVRQTKQQADESDQAFRDARNSPEADRFEPSDELRKMFRDLAKKVHPDLARDPAEVARRTEIMKQMNIAYARGDCEALADLARQWEHSPEAIKGEGMAQDLVRTIRQIAQIQTRFAAIDTQTATLLDSDMARLRDEVRNAEILGRDLLVEMTVEVQERVRVARTCLDSLLRQGQPT
ncbi:MAG: J domain-containing protein [Anaerolineae bacterium]